jgi:hypothetical protein
MNFYFNLKGTTFIKCVRNFLALIFLLSLSIKGETSQNKNVESAFKENIVKQPRLKIIKKATNHLTNICQFPFINKDPNRQYNTDTFS